MLFGQKHVERYIQTDGAEGQDWNGAKTLILTTRGRRSGLERQAPLIYQPYDGGYVLVASKGGAPEHPSWYENLVADPHVKVQVGAERFDAIARTAEGEERERLWPLMTEAWPSYDDYQRKTDREIPVVVLERA